MSASSPRAPRRAGRPFLAFLIAGVLLSGCADDPADPAAAPSESSTSPTQGGTAVTAPTTQNPDAVPVTVTETEFSLALSQKTFRPGDYVFTYSNTGKLPHNLALEGPGVNEPGTSAVMTDQSGELRVTLQKGTYTMWCGVGDHRDKGMEITLTVT